jgi:cation diffusion facilitator family transporter
MPKAHHVPAGRHHHGRPRRRWLAEVFHTHSHEMSGSADLVADDNAEGVRVLKVSLVVLLGTAVLQLLVAVVSGSVALLADTVHNFSDALTAVPLWVAFALARRPATRRYTYGLGRAEDLAGVFIVAMIALSAVLAAVESVRRLMDPQPIGHLVWVMLAGALGFAGNEAVAIYRIRAGRRIGSAALVADGLHARTDGFTSLAVVAGAAGVAAGFPLADPIVGLLVTGAILFVLRGAAVEVYRRLMDGVDPSLTTAAEAALHAVEGVRGVDELRLRWLGHRLRAEARLAVDPEATLAQAHAIAHRAEARLRQALPRVSGAIVHVHPAGAPAVA